MFTLNKDIFIVFWVTAIVVGSLLFYFIYFMLRKQKEIRKMQKLATRSQNKAIREERKELATQLHNDIAPLLAGLKMRINNLETSNPESLEVCKLALEESIQKVRKISKAIAPLSMLNISFREAITQYIDSFSAGSDLVVHYQDSTAIPLGEDMNNEIYRILQEIIQNTIRHAQAKNLFIEISYTPGQLLIRTKDDGVSYDFGQLLVEKKLGLGLLNMRTRIENLNGTLYSPDKSTKGTRYNIRIPIPS